MQRAPKGTHQLNQALTQTSYNRILTSGHKEVFRVQKFETKQCKNTFNWKGTSVHKITVKQLRLIKERTIKAFPCILHLSICTISCLQQNLVNIHRLTRMPHCLWHLLSTSEPTDWLVFNLIGGGLFYDAVSTLHSGFWCSSLAIICSTVQLSMGQKLHTHTHTKAVLCSYCQTSYTCYICSHARGTWIPVFCTSLHAFDSSTKGAN